MKISYLDGLLFATGTFFSISILENVDDPTRIRISRYGSGMPRVEREMLRIDGNLDMEQQY
jgi:hypothetical protein